MSNLSVQKEFEKAILDYGGLITKICYYFSSDTEEFKDLRQEVFYNIWKGWTQFKKDSKISTWIYRVTFNTCVSYNRKEKKKRKTISIDEVAEMPAEADSELMDKYNEMHALIHKLNLEDRAIILMWLDEKPYDEIAALMGMNRNTVAIRLKRIKDKLVKWSQLID